MRADIRDMSTLGPEERLRIAFERYRAVMAAHGTRFSGTALDVATARLDLSLRLVEAGERLPEPVAEQLQQDALVLVDATEALAATR